MNSIAAKGQCICEGPVRFRPSDWPIRLASLDATFGADRRLRFSRYLQPVDRGGRRCVRLHADAERDHPTLWRTVLDFARANALSIQPIENPPSADC